MSSQIGPRYNSSDTPRPAAVLDVDGTLIDGEPLILEGSRKIFEYSVENVTAMSVEIEPSIEFFESDSWDQLLGTLEDLETEEYLQPEQLEEMYRAAHRYASGEEDYLNAARDITWNWSTAVKGMREEEVRDYAEKYIRQEMDGRVEREAHNIVGHLSGTHDLYFVSNNPQELLEPFADYVTGIPISRDNVYGTKVAVNEEGRYKDELERNMLQAEGKQTAMDEISQKSDLDEHSIAIGDSEADLPLFHGVSEAILLSTNGADTVEVIREELEEAGKPSSRFTVEDSLKDVLDHLYNRKDVGPNNGA